MDTTMRDADDVEGDNDNDNDNDEDNNNEPDMDAEAGQDAESSSNTDQVSEALGAPPSQPNPPTISPRPTNNETIMSEFHPSVRPECLTASTYDIVPTTAAPHSTSINAITATADMRWVFSGGSDGYVRQFNWVESVNSKSMLTVAQRHPFVDSVVKAGMLMTYWGNMDKDALSPVYSLACQSEGLWILTGLESGCIRLQSVRHEEGREIAALREHKSTVSVLTMTPDEKSLLSGSWDKRVLDWDLNTGQVRRSFGDSTAQISSVEFRPESNIPVPQDTLEPPLTNGTYSSNYQAGGHGSFSFTDGIGNSQGDTSNDLAASPAGSLFSESGSLFGDGDAIGEMGDDTATTSETLTNGIGVKAEPQEGTEQTNGTVTEGTSSQDPTATNIPNKTESSQEAESGIPNGVSSEPAFNSDSNNDINDNINDSNNDISAIPNSEPTTEPNSQQQQQPSFESSQAQYGSNDSTFLASSIDGNIRIWDRRQQNPVARITAHNAPPWCMNACWSPDGNYLYAGRRNSTVEEFSFHKGLRIPERTFKLPLGSGPVTALKAMPNGRHLVW